MRHVRNRRFAAAVLLLAAAIAARPLPAQRLKIGVVQMAQAPSIAGNRDRIVEGISAAAQRGARVVVFPEAALMGEGSDDLAQVDAAMATIRNAARHKNVYALVGATTHTPTLKRNTNWMVAIGPDGRELLHYDKLYDRPTSPLPGIFEIDGIPCSAMICADRWLRALEELPVQQGARITFELSCNSSVEWVSEFGWYWYIPRALRNNVWVVFANTGNLTSGVAPYAGAELRHGHSAIVAPDGRIVARAVDDVATVLVAEIDVAEATRAEALARARHPALRSFWEAGVRRAQGKSLRATPLVPFKSPPVDVTLAAAQVTGDPAAMSRALRAARERGADLVAFPARALAYRDLPRLQSAARENQITVVVGSEFAVPPGSAGVPPASARANRDAHAPRNSAFVVGPDGAVLTRYDQLSARPPFAPGSDAKAMWFRVKGVPAVVLLERDAWWTELAELAALAGAQVIVHLDHEEGAPADALLRRQMVSNLASYQTFTLSANVAHSMIWDDLRGAEERRAPVGQRLPESGAVVVYSPFSANLVAAAHSPEELVVATRRVNETNRYHTGTIARKNPQMDAWFRLGAASIQPPATLNPTSP